MPTEPRLIKGRQLTGLPVIATSAGTTLGDVREVLFDDQLQRICAVLIAEGGWLKGAKLIDWEDLQQISADFVTVADEAVVLDSSEQKELQELCQQRNGLKGYTLVTEKGEDLGTIEDIVFDAATGKIAGYELSRGVVQDLLEGRWEVFLPEQVRVSDRTVLVPEGQAYFYQPEHRD